MEWEFTTSQVMNGEVEYSLDDFYRDLENELDFNIDKYEIKEKANVLILFYAVIYLTATGREVEKVHELTEIPIDLIEYVVENCQENIEMLKAIIQRRFLYNIETSKGLLPNHLNTLFVNAYLRQCHQKLNLIQ